MQILVVDDHELIREALRSVLRELQPDATVLEAGNWGEASVLIKSHPDLALVLLDLALPDHDGFLVLGEIRARYPTISTVILSAFNDRINVVRALDAGALGFIPKSQPREVLLGALRIVFSGGIYIPPDILLPPMKGTLPSIAASIGPPLSPASLGLTERQIDVLALMMKGKSNKAICRTLDLAEPTVKNHVSAILRALAVTNRTEAVIAATSLDWNLPRLAK